MQTFDLRSSPIKPWANGGGTRQELISRREDDRPLWWMSVASIAQDGPFSTYPGLARLHVVTSGPGTHLGGEGIDLDVRPMQPVPFDGDAELTCQLKAGPCTALNLVYDPARIAAKMSALAAGAHEVRAHEIAVFVVTGAAALDGTALQAGQGAVVADAATITVRPSAAVLCALLDPL